MLTTDFKGVKLRNQFDRGFTTPVSQSLEILLISEQWFRHSSGSIDSTETGLKTFQAGYHVFELVILGGDAVPA